MKRWKQGIGLMSAALLLSGCLSNLDSEPKNVTEVKPNEVLVQPVTKQMSQNDYRAVVTNGRYTLGVSASVDSNLSSSRNSKAFEEGLLAISKSVFPVDQYYLREGQLIDASTMTSWIARESNLYPEGLNPKLPEVEKPAEESSSDSEGTEEQSGQTTAQVTLDGADTPIYLAQILEKDIMVETEDGYALGGVVLGLAMNSVYEYTDSNGVKHTQEISIGEMRERGKAYANIIVGRLRNTEQLRSVPIVVGLFRQAPTDSQVGGTYIIDGISREGNAVTDWTEHNENRVSLPLVNSDESPDQYQYFYDFREKVIGFFPNLNGITAQAFYSNGTLANLDIEVVTQFYQQTEVIALTQYLVEVAEATLPSNMPVTIKIDSGAGTQAYISRANGSTLYQTQVFK